MAKVYLSFKPHDFLCCGTKKSKEEEIGRGQCDWDKKQTGSGSRNSLLPGIDVQFTAEALPDFLAKCEYLRKGYAIPLFRSLLFHEISMVVEFRSV